MDCEVSQLPVRSVDYLDFPQDCGFQPDQTSRDFAWSGLFAMSVSAPNLPDCQFFLPPLAENTLLVHVENPAQLQLQIDHANIPFASQPGMFSSFPPAKSTSWQILSGPPQVVIIYLKNELLTRVALEVLNWDLQAIEFNQNIAVNDPFIYSLGVTVQHELKTPGYGGNLFIESLGQALAVYMFRKYTVTSRAAPPPKGQLPTKTLRAILNYIRERLDQDLRLEEIAELANLSAFHFARLFKQTVGMPVHQYVLEQRLEAGRDLLLQGEISVTEVAACTGFADLSHFSRHFKRRYGVSPLSILRQGKNRQIERKIIPD